MSRRFRDWWFDNFGVVVLALLAVLMVGMFVGMWYVENHHSYTLTYEVRVNVSGGLVWFDKNSTGAGGRNQFYASNELGRSKMCMTPSFEIVNTSEDSREVRIHSLSGWEVPISGVVHLEPGQRFQFSLTAHPASKHWYCWIEPQPPRNRKSAKT